jgi:DNA-binding HxlR family transcriptional regulator
MGVESHPDLCPLFHHAVEVIGKRWSGAIVMLLMQREAVRFTELLSAIPGISDRLLSERLRELEGEGIVERVVEGGRPVRVSYKLTACGRALEPAITALGEWAADTYQSKRAAASPGESLVRSAQ